MKFSEDNNSENNNIRNYGKGFIQIKEKQVNTSVVIGAQRLISDWEPNTFADLKAEHCEILFIHKPDVIILGTGKRQCFPERDILRLFAQQQIGVEVMDTASACRTFNILLSEDRNVVAALFMI
jgi:uncharacterized protein